MGEGIYFFKLSFLSLHSTKESITIRSLRVENCISEFIMAQQSQSQSDQNTKTIVFAFTFNLFIVNYYIYQPNSKMKKMHSNFCLTNQIFFTFIVIMMRMVGWSSVLVVCSYPHSSRLSGRLQSESNQGREKKTSDDNDDEDDNADHYND